MYVLYTIVCMSQLNNIQNALIWYANNTNKIRSLRNNVCHCVFIFDLMTEICSSSDSLLVFCDAMIMNNNTCEVVISLLDYDSPM